MCMSTDNVIFCFFILFWPVLPFVRSTFLLVPMNRPFYLFFCLFFIIWFFIEMFTFFKCGPTSKVSLLVFLVFDITAVSLLLFFNSECKLISFITYSPDISCPKHEIHKIGPVVLSWICSVGLEFLQVILGPLRRSPKATCRASLVKGSPSVSSRLASFLLDFLHNLVEWLYCHDSIVRASCVEAGYIFGRWGWRLNRRGCGMHFTVPCRLHFFLI